MSRESKNSAREVALPTAAASSRMRRIRSSGSNGWPLTIPIAASCPMSSAFGAAGGLVLHHLVHQLEEAEVARRHRVERLPAALDEHRLGNLRRCSGRRAALEQRRDARAGGARRVGVELQRALDRLDGRRRVVVRQERPPEQERPRRARVSDVVAAVRQRAVVAGRDEQEAAAFAAIRARQAEVDDPAPPHVVEHPERLRRRLDDHRARREIDDAEEVDGVGVRGQEHGLRAHQLREDEDRVVLDAGVVEALPDRVRRRAREAVEVHVEAVHEVEMVVDALGGLAGRHAVDELERPEPGLELLRRPDRAKRLAGNGHLVTSWSAAARDPGPSAICLRQLRVEYGPPARPSSSYRLHEIESRGEHCAAVRWEWSVPTSIRSIRVRMNVTKVPFDLAEAKLAAPSVRPGTVAKSAVIARLCTAIVPIDDRGRARRVRQDDAACALGGG